MLKRMVFLLIFSGCISAFAIDECPVAIGSSDYSAQVGTQIKNAKTCEEGAEIAGICAFASSLDGQTTVVAERKCGLDFWNKLSKAEKAIYNGLQDKCFNKYKKFDAGSFQSEMAFCKLSVARLYSNLYSPVKEN